MYKHAIFDLDGTLVDSSTEIYAAVKVACSEHGLQLPCLDYIRASIGLHPSKFFADHGASDQETITNCVSFFRRQLFQNAGDPCLVMPGVSSLLESLAHEGVVMSCATTKPTVLALELMGRYGLKEYFQHIQGTDPPMCCKPAPHVVEACLHRAGGLPAVMIGDTVLDIQAARSAGVDSAAVAAGADTVEKLKQEKPTYLFSTISHVRRLF